MLLGSGQGRARDRGDTGQQGKGGALNLLLDTTPHPATSHPPHWGGHSTSRPGPLLFCLLGHCFLILTGQAATLPPPGCLQNLPGQGYSVLR